MWKILKPLLEIAFTAAALLKSIVSYILLHPYGVCTLWKYQTASVLRGKSEGTQDKPFKTNNLISIWGFLQRHFRSHRRIFRRIST